MDFKELLGEELYSQVKEKIGDKKIMVDDGNFIPKSRFDEVNSQKKELKEQVDNLNKNLNENNKALEKFKLNAEMSEELKKQLEEIQSKANNTQKDFETKLTAKEQEWAEREINNRKSYAMREKLLVENADPKYIDLLMGQVDLSKISENNGKFIGIDDVAKEIKTNFDKLFGKVSISGTGASTGNANQATQVSKESIKNMTADEINKNWEAVQETLKNKE